MRRRGKRKLKINSFGIVTTLQLFNLVRILQNVGEVRHNWIRTRAVKLNIEHLRFTVVCSSCHENRHRDNFTLLFCREWHGILLKCVPHVWQVYLPAFGQSNSQCVALPLPFPSCMLQLPIRELKQPWRRRRQERHKFAYLTMKKEYFCTLSTCVYHFRFARAFIIFALHVRFSFLLVRLSFLYILQSLSFLPRREITCFVVTWTTIRIWNKYLVSYFHS